MRVLVANDHAPLAVYGNAVRKVELSRAKALFADRSDVLTICAPEYFDSVVEGVSDDNMATTVESYAGRMI